MEYTTGIRVCYDDQAAHRSLTALLDRCQPSEVACVLAELRAGRLSGQWLEDCVIGIVARGRGQDYFSSGLACDETLPFEDWLLALVWGQTPATHPRAQLLESWLVTWLDEHTIEMPVAVAERVL